MERVAAIPCGQVTKFRADAVDFLNNARCQAYYHDRLLHDISYITAVTTLDLHILAYMSSRLLRQKDNAHCRVCVSLDVPTLDKPIEQKGNTSFSG